MTRLELLQLVIGRARSNGFELRRWYTHRLGLPWISAEASIALLDTQRRYYALIFSHEFAQCFWKPGVEIAFDVPPQSFERSMPDGSTRTVQRRAYVRRSSRPNAWKYHLRQMALAEEPLRYLRRYLHVEDETLAETSETALPFAHVASKAPPPARAKVPNRPKPSAAAPSSSVPAFLQRPYKPQNKQ